jgi:hypothetical protein
MRYSLHDFTLDQAAQSNVTTGGNTYMTHNFTCGACSSLADLDVYLEKPDLTTPVKSCTIKGTLKPWLTEEEYRKQVSECIEENLGFSEMCSTVWVYNTQNTK